MTLTWYPPPGGGTLPGGTLPGGYPARGGPCRGYPPRGGTLPGGSRYPPGGTLGGYPARGGSGYPPGGGVPCWGGPGTPLGGYPAWGGPCHPAGGGSYLCGVQAATELFCCELALYSLMPHGIMGNVAKHHGSKKKKKKKNYGMGTPPPVDRQIDGWTDTCQNITFPSYYVRGR